MKIAGLIGGIGPESTVSYYQQMINGFRSVRQDNSYPDINIVSIDMTRMLSLVEKRDFDSLVAMLRLSIEKLARAGSDFVAITSNTPHIVFDRVRDASPLELISIVDATCEFIKSEGYRKPLLTGTLFTMKENFYGTAAREHGFDIQLPNEKDIESIHDVIFPELEEGLVIPEKKAKYIDIVTRYIRELNIDSVILGCTELPLMVSASDLPVPVIDTCSVHVSKILERMLADA
jgi:aspartate racemase